MNLDEIFYNNKLKQLVKNYDGDSFWALVDLGYKVQVTLDYRLDGIDTPELKDVGGPEARDYFEQRVNSALKVKETVWLRARNYEKEKYGRQLVRVYIGQECLNQTMLNMSMGKPYNGGRR